MTEAKKMPLYTFKCSEFKKKYIIDHKKLKNTANLAVISLPSFLLSALCSFLDCSPKSYHTYNYWHGNGKKICYISQSPKIATTIAVAITTWKAIQNKLIYKTYTQIES